MAISRPSEIKPKSTISILIYGQPSIGKTTLGCSAANAVLFDFDGGVNRIHPAHMIDTVQVESWEQVQEALNELASPEFANIRTIVIDTFGKMLNCMESQKQWMADNYASMEGDTSRFFRNSQLTPSYRGMQAGVKYAEGFVRALDGHRTRFTERVLP